MKKTLYTFLLCLMATMMALAGQKNSPNSGVTRHKVAPVTYAFKTSSVPADTGFISGTHWYKIANARSAWLVYNTDGTVDMTSTEPATYNTAALWCLTGDSVSGYTFYNKATGPTMVVTYGSEADNIQCSLATKDATKYQVFKINTSTAATNSYAFHYGTNCYLNNYAGKGKLSTWNSTSGANDAGSALVFTEVSEDEMQMPDSVTYTISSSTATLYRDGTTATTTSFAKLLKTNGTPTVQLSTSANNMNWSGTNVALYPGAGGSCTFTLAAPQGYLIESYSFTATQVSGNTSTDMTLTVDTTTYNTSTAQTITNTRFNESSLTIVQTGSNKGVALSDFVVKIKVEKPEKPIVSTPGDTVWYYITSASTKDYCTGKVMYADAAQNGKMRFGDKQFDAQYIWSFWEKNGKLAIRNYAGLYLGTAGSGTGNSTQFCAQTTPNYTYTINDAYGYFTIKDTGTELHAQSDYQVIVRWAADEGNASLWRFSEVDCSHPQAVLSSTSVQQGRVTTGIGNHNVPIVRSTLNVGGLTGALDFRGVTGTITGTGASSVEKVKVYFADNACELFVDEDKQMTWREENGQLFGEATVTGSTFTLLCDTVRHLAPGTHYLWITYDISKDAQEGQTVDATLTTYTIDDQQIDEANGNPANQATIFLTEGTVLMPRDLGSTYYRIPAITQVQKNGKTRLVTLSDDRKEHNGDLPSHCYVVAQYSDDLGKTWTKPVTVAGTATTGGDYGHGDASLVTNRNTGEIVGIMTSAGTYGHGFFSGTAAQPPRWKTIVSRDGGETWEAPVDHTDELFGAGCKDSVSCTWKSGFSGSGAALQKRDGTLVSSFVNRDSANVQNFYFFFSEDNGQTWHRQGTSGTTSCDEPKTLERNNGDLAISVRQYGYNFHNVTSDDGLTWKYPSQTRFTNGIWGNGCDGEYMVWCAKKEGNFVGKSAAGDSICDIAFQTGPNNASRQNVSIAISTDEGETFESVKTICPCGSAYSACVVLPDGTLGVYYEENGVYGCFTMRFVRFSLDWASDGKYSFSAEHPFQPIQSTSGETGISAPRTAQNHCARRGTYDLQGRPSEATPAQRGIYIRDGRKTVVR